MQGLLVAPVLNGTELRSQDRFRLHFCLVPRDVAWFPEMLHLLPSGHEGHVAVDTPSCDRIDALSFLASLSSRAAGDVERWHSDAVAEHPHPPYIRVVCMGWDTHHRFTLRVEEHKLRHPSDPILCEFWGPLGVVDIDQRVVHSPLVLLLNFIR